MAKKKTKKKATAAPSDRRVLVKNRKARHNYEIVDTIECGIVLVGTEVKSIRDGKVSMGDGYGSIERGEMWLVQMHITAYDAASSFNHDPLRKRKLLLHRREINRLESKVAEQGFTLIPLAVTMVKNRVKIDMGLCRGKKMYDKRETNKERDAKREMERAKRSAMR